jgi:hypothetical protein
MPAIFAVGFRNGAFVTVKIKRNDRFITCGIGYLHGYHLVSFKNPFADIRRKKSSKLEVFA